MVGAIHHLLSAFCWLLLVSTPGFSCFSCTLLSICCNCTQVFKPHFYLNLQQSSHSVHQLPSNHVTIEYFYHMISVTGWRKYCLYISNSSVNSLPALDLQGAPAKNLGQAKKATLWRQWGNWWLTVWRKRRECSFPRCFLLLIPFRLFLFLFQALQLHLKCMSLPL